MTCQISMMELFVKIYNWKQPLPISTKISFLGVWQDSQIDRCLTGFWKHVSGLIYLVPLTFHSHNKWSSQRRCSIKKAFLKDVAIFTEKHLCWSLFFNKVVEASNFIKKKLQQKCFPMNVAKILKQLFWRTSANECLCCVSLV